MSPTKGAFASRPWAAIASTASTRRSDVTVFDGQATYEGREHGAAGRPPASTRSSGSTPPASPQYAMVGAGARRVRGLERRSRSRRGPHRDGVDARYVSPEMTGAEDLDRYGAVGADARIRRDLDAALGRRPTGRRTRTGHWAWVRPWGWTWVDDAPWGFAPFHYGRWVYHRNAWCWAPGHLRRAGRSTRRRWWPGSAARAPTCRSRSAAARRSAGSRSRRARSTCRPTGSARAMCSTSTSPTSPTSPTSRRSSTTATARPTGAISRTASTRMR